MNATTFILIVVVAYIFYFTLMVVMDAAKFSKAAVAIASGKQDFVIPQVQHNPVKVTIANTYENDLPQLQNVNSSVFEALRNIYKNIQQKELVELNILQ